jgi:outer membrane protein assembly factor BamD (BamD/ComL family)
MQPVTEEKKPKPVQYVGDCRDLKKEALRMDSVIMVQTEVKKEIANKGIKAFTDFAYYCSGDSLSPVFLIKTAQVAKASENIPQAKLVLEKCIEMFPNFKDKGAAMFLLAQLYDENNFMHDGSEARRLYNQIIIDYPRSEWAVNAKGALRFSGKSDEEIIKELKKKK